jgi:hypothetical protein
MLIFQAIYRFLAFLYERKEIDSGTPELMMPCCLDPICKISQL